MWDVTTFAIGALVSLSLSEVHPLSLGGGVCTAEGCGHLRKRLLIINPFPGGQ